MERLDAPTQPAKESSPDTSANGPKAQQVLAMRKVRDTPITPTPPTVSAHPFAHLGPAPYTFTSASSTYDRQATMTERKSSGLTYSENVSGSCDHCGMCISDFYYFKAANGTVFKVGSTCYEKGLVDESVYADARALRQATQAKHAPWPSASAT